MKENKIKRRIGSTTYTVRVEFKPEAKESVEDKMLRLIHNEVLENVSECDKMTSPQVSRLPERSA